MHPTKHTAEALDDIVKYYVDKGFSIVPLVKI